MFKQLFTFIIFISLSHFCLAQDYNYSTIDESLMDKLESTTDKMFDIYIILEDKVDIREIDQRLTAQRAPRSQRAKTIMSALQNKAQTSQASLLKMLSKEAGVQKETIKPYWVTNVIFMRADRATLAKLSHDHRIEYVGIDGKLDLVESEDGAAATVAPNGVERGLDMINVRPLWELGYTGYGQLAMLADTGADSDHNAFGSRYRGNTNSDSEAWYSFQDQPASPFQCGDHGTHVLGTVLGLDRIANDTIGVAFDAQWLGAANLCGGGTQSNVGAFEWAMNPDNNEATTDDMADVINNSWRDPSVSNSQCNSVYLNLLDALEAMGVVVVFSAGNSGPDPRTITAPKNISINEVNSFAVGALNGNTSSLPIADFSSRGPSICEGEGSLAIKPEVSAPGVSVRSAGLNNTYNLKSGTSMASPHVSGSLLVLRQAFPEVGARELKLALYNSCRDLGEPGEDNTFGMGIIDVYAAYNYLIAEGNVPAPPISSQNDIMAFELITNEFECDGQLTGELSFFNNSPDTVFTMEILFTIDGEISNELSETWEGSIAPFTADTLTLDAIDLPTGQFNIAVELASPNGNQDERPLNNMTSKEITISAEEGLEILELEEQVVCEGANMLIRTNYAGDGVVQWFDSRDGGNLIVEGTQVTIEADESKTIYAHVLNREIAGKIPTSTDIIDLSNEPGVGITFDGLAPFQVTEIDFYSETEGIMIAALQDGRGDQILTEIIRSDGSGWQTTEVRWRLAAGFGYRLLYDAGVIELGVTDSDVDYPYTIDNILEVTGGIGSTSYPYFFNIKVQYQDLCGSTAVVIDAVQTDELPLANFEMDFDEINLNSNQAVNFTNSSENGASYLWDFGDGNTSQEENPSHIYEETGTFFVSLMAINEDGCSDAFVSTVEVFSTTGIFSPAVEIENSFEISPNPFSQRLNFSTDSPIQVDRVDMYNSAGLLVQSFRIGSSVSSHSQEMGDLVPGLYYVLIHTEIGVDTHKVIKH